MDRDRIAEMFAAFGRVDVRRMFGGAGIYADGIMFALGDVAPNFYPGATGVWRLISSTVGATGPGAEPSV